MEAVRAFNNELSSLYETKPPISRAKMAAVTKAAIKGIKFYKHIVQSVEKFVQKCRPEYKVPGLYVVDSIVRQSRHQFSPDKDVFVPRFTKNLIATFQHLFKCPPDERSKIVRVLNLWQKNNVFPVEVIQPLLDMAVDPNNPQALASAQQAVENMLAKNSSQKQQSKPPVEPKAELEPPAQEGNHSGEGEGQQQGAGGWTGWQAAAADNSDMLKTVTELIHASQQSGSLSDQAAQLEQLQSLQHQLVQQSHLLGQAQTAQQQQALMDSNLLAQITVLTQTLLNKSPQAQDSGFNKKLLDFDYGESDDEEEKKPSVTPNNSGIGNVQSILNDPTVLQQIQQMSQTLQKTEQLRTELQQEEMRQQMLQQQQEEFDQQIMQSHDSQDSSFNQKLLDFDYGESDDEEEKKPSVTPNNSGIGNVQSILNDPTVLQQIQQMSQTLQKTEQLRTELQQEEMRQQMLQQQQAEFDQQIMQSHDSQDSSFNQVSDGTAATRGEPPLPGEHQSSSREDKRRRRSRDRSRSPNRKRKKRSRSRERRKRSRSRSRSRSKGHRRSRSREREKEKRDRERDRERRKKGLPPVREKHLAICSTTLFIGHIAKNTTEEELREVVENYGQVTSINMIPPRGCAFVCLNGRKEASRAVEKLKGIKINGSALKTDWAPGKGIKECRLNEFWDKELGVTYIPWNKLPEDLSEAAEGGLIDEETLPENLKGAKTNTDEDSMGTPLENMGTPSSQFNLGPSAMPTAPQFPPTLMGMMPPMVPGMLPMMMPHMMPPLPPGVPAAMPGAPPLPSMPPVDPNKPEPPTSAAQAQLNMQPSSTVPGRAGVGGSNQLAQAIQNIVANSASITAVANTSTPGMMAPPRPRLPGMPNMPNFGMPPPGFDMSKPPPGVSGAMGGGPQGGPPGASNGPQSGKSISEVLQSFTGQTSIPKPQQPQQQPQDMDMEIEDDDHDQSESAYNKPNHFQGQSLSHQQPVMGIGVIGLRAPRPDSSPLSRGPGEPRPSGQGDFRPRGIIPGNLLRPDLSPRGGSNMVGPRFPGQSIGPGGSQPRLPGPDINPVRGMGPDVGQQRFPGPGGSLLRPGGPDVSPQRHPGPDMGPQRHLVPDAGPPPQRHPGPNLGLPRLIGPPDRGLPRHPGPEMSPQRPMAPDMGPQRHQAPDMGGLQRLPGPDLGPPRLSGPDMGPRGQMGDMRPRLGGPMGMNPMVMASRPGGIPSLMQQRFGPPGLRIGGPPQQGIFPPRFGGMGFQSRPTLGFRGPSQPGAIDGPGTFDPPLQGFNGNSREDQFPLDHRPEEDHFNREKSQRWGGDRNSDFRGGNDNRDLRHEQREDRQGRDRFSRDRNDSRDRDRHDSWNRDRDWDRDRDRHHNSRRDSRRDSDRGDRDRPDRERDRHERDRSNRDRDRSEREREHSDRDQRDGDKIEKRRSRWGFDTKPEDDNEAANKQENKQHFDNEIQNNNNQSQEIAAPTSQENAAPIVHDNTHATVDEQENELLVKNNNLKVLTSSSENDVETIPNVVESPKTEQTSNVEVNVGESVQEES
ncbi:protein SCAF8 [Lingula anatina]|uniref:Protein SCAF8 n=1 Tax=Lingula anatina TaxID=7574 RepID=A0A1S3HG85_LINAN|nr:protein SCAF8 [Lingula anatina]|eukprot:XP_013385088.1 protein SCAF8 [Lingula anatina]